MTVSEFYTYTFVVFDEIAYEWVQGSYVAFEIKIFDEDQEVIVLLSNSPCERVKPAIHCFWGMSR